jgi:membrane protease YdiL (CAAX protease family)
MDRSWQGGDAMFFQNAYIGRNGWWRWLITIAAVILVIFLAQAPLLGFITLEAERLGLTPDVFFARLPEGVDRNLFLALFLLPFTAAFLMLWLCIRVLHRKSLRFVTTGRPRFDWSRAIIGFVFWFAVLSVTIFAVLPAETYVYQFDPAKFWPLLLIALLMFPVQTTLEEVFFRGYLMQGVFLLARNKIVPLIVVTLAFLFVHYWNPEFSQEDGAGIIEYFLMSTFLGLITVLDDGLELPCGIHAANNIFLAVILSTSDGSLQTNAIFETSLKAFGDNVLILAIAPYVAGFLLLFAMYRWRLSTIFERVPPAKVAPASSYE